MPEQKSVALDKTASEYRSYQFDQGQHYAVQSALFKHITRSASRVDFPFVQTIFCCSPIEAAH